MQNAAYGFTLAFHFKRCVQVRAESLPAAGTLKAGLGQENDEGLAAESAGNIAFPDVGLKQHSGSTKDGIAGIQSIVFRSVPEIVQGQHNHAQGFWFVLRGAVPTPGILP